jgi:hypothetical protein
MQPHRRRGAAGRLRQDGAGAVDGRGQCRQAGHHADRRPAQLRLFQGRSIATTDIWNLAPHRFAGRIDAKSGTSSKGSSLRPSGSAT